MSSDDFQTKYSSVMESMLKSAIAETTKLFETMVDDLKAEISKIKTENEDLKRRCSQFENARSKTTTMRESESVPGQSRGSDKRDTAVQCDLVPFCTMLVEQCEPLTPSSMQNQEQLCANVTTQDVWQEHNYENRGKRDSLIALLPKKQLQFDFKQKEVEPIGSFGQVFRNVKDLKRVLQSRIVSRRLCSGAGMPLTREQRPDDPWKLGPLAPIPPHPLQNLLRNNSDEVLIQHSQNDNKSCCESTWPPFVQTFICSFWLQVQLL
ncbi:uncharacterized protein [Labrus bergylta]|uniref:uncharacterized protein isoform X4 n=1 Tax=Labrus bergylta TaxID=56723 RepID=UPI003313D495